MIPDDTLWKIDENGTVDKTLDIGHEPGALGYFDGAIWVGSNGVVQRVDPGSDQITPYPVADRTQAFAAGHRVLYVSTGQSPPKLKTLP